MKFELVPVDQAEGRILAHNLARVSRRGAFRKGKPLTAEDLRAIRQEGYSSIYVAELEPGDVDENRAAQQIAEAAAGAGLALKGPSAGRIGLQAQVRGVLRVDATRLERLNECPGVAFATLPSYSVADAGQTVATIKIIPYSMPEVLLVQAEACARGEIPLITLQELKPRRVGLVFSGLPAAENRIVKSFEQPLRRRVDACGSQVAAVDFVPMLALDDGRALAGALRRQADEGVEMIVLAGETSIMDADDVTPRAIRLAGGEVVCVGAPVDPGNLLMIAYLGDIPVLGAPGCARSPKPNVVDRVLPALLAGYRLSLPDIARLGHGGLLE